MTLGLRQVRDLVANWKHDALANNDVYFDKLKNRQIDEYLAEHKDLSDLIDKTKKALNDAVQGNQELYDITGKGFFLVNDRNVRELCFEEGESRSMRKFPFLGKIYSDRMQKNQEISVEYIKLNERITGCKTAKKAKQMLADMGLDVSSLEETVNPPVALEDTPLNLVLMGLKKGE